MSNTVMFLIIGIVMTALFSYAAGGEADKTPGGERKLEVCACGQKIFIPEKIVVC